MSKLIAELENELATLEAELSSDARYRRLVRVRDLLAEYQSADDAEARALARETATWMARAPVPYATALPDGFKTVNVALTKAERLRIATQKFLRECKGRVHRKALVKHLMDIGEYPEDTKNPVNSFAVYLAKWDEFASDGRGNVIFMEEATKAATNGAAHE
jgi:hypothetical protein